MDLLTRGSQEIKEPHHAHLPPTSYPRLLGWGSHNPFHLCNWLHKCCFYFSLALFSQPQQPLSLHGLCIPFMYETCSHQAHNRQSIIVFEKLFVRSQHRLVSNNQVSNFFETLHIINLLVLAIASGTHFFGYVFMQQVPTSYV